MWIFFINDNFFARFESFYYTNYADYLTHGVGRVNLTKVVQLIDFAGIEKFCFYQFVSNFGINCNFYCVVDLSGFDFSSKKYAFFTSILVFS